MKSIKLLFVLAFVASTAVAASDRTWFTAGYGRGEKVQFQSELLARLNEEAMPIARVLIEADLMEGTRVSVIESPRSSYGFETKFECTKEQAKSLRDTRAEKVHGAMGRRYEQLIAAALSREQIKNPAVLPLHDYISQIRTKG